MGSARPTTTPSDLAEYAFCPRARYYRHRYGAPAPTASAERGIRYHAVELAGVRRREKGRTAYVLVALAGVALVVLGLVGLLG